MGKSRPRLSQVEVNIIKAHRLGAEESRVLVIGDPHEPFCLDGYLEFCFDTYNNWNCNRVVHIGDHCDNHYSSYHETDPDGFGGGDELDLLIYKTKGWVQAFPKLDWIIGNHDRIIGRKAMTGNLSKRWLKPYNEVIEAPGWKLTESLEIDDVQYVHGEGGKADRRAKNDLMSTVQGHYHTDAFTKYWVGKNYKIFGCAVGCGIDIKSYSQAYAKNFPKPAIGCAVIIGGKQAINVMMEL